MACNDINSNCTDSCEQIDGLFEAASNLVQYRDIIEEWLHGKQNETVQIGGEQVKTLLGLIADIKQLIGVLPDGRTIILDDKRKVLSVLLAEGGGIKVKAEGGLYVDVNDILVLGGGLAKDEDGKIYVDFSQMPTDKFEALLKSIRVPIWLTANKNFYVNGTTGSDTLDEDRGESEGKPFRTLQACVDFICDNYNLSKYNVTIRSKNIKNDTILKLKSYNATSGIIEIRGIDDESRISSLRLSSSAIYNIVNLSIDGNYATHSICYLVYVGSGVVNLYNVKLDIRERHSSGKYKDIGIEVYDNGVVNIPSSDNDETGIRIDVSQNNSPNFLLNARDGGKIGVSADISIYGDCNIASSFANSSRLGLISFVKSAKAYPGRSPVVTSYGTVYGKRYNATLNGIISTGRKGAEFFPGTEPGTTSTGGQYL